MYPLRKEKKSQMFARYISVRWPITQICTSTMLPFIYTRRTYYQNHDIMFSDAYYFSWHSFDSSFLAKCCFDSKLLDGGKIRSVVWGSRSRGIKLLFCVFTKWFKIGQHMWHRRSIKNSTMCLNSKCDNLCSRGQKEFRTHCIVKTIIYIFCHFISDLLKIKVVNL